MAADTSKEIKVTKSDTSEVTLLQEKDSKHGSYYSNVKVIDVQWNEFFVNASVPGPIKIEESHLTHPTYNPDKKIEKVVKWRMQKFLDKQKKIDNMKTTD